MTEPKAGEADGAGGFLSTPIDAFVEYARTRDPARRDALVNAHLGLAEHLARRFANRGEPLDDLVQVASIGLLKAIDRFEPDRGLVFSTFATPTIVGELKRHFRDKGWSVRVPRRVQELHLRLGAVVEDLTQQLGRSPTLGEIAAAASSTEEQVLEALDASHAYRARSIDAPAGDDDEGDAALSARLGEDDPRLATSELRAELSPLLAVLPNRERIILHMRFFEGRTQSEIAVHLGISQMQVSRLLARSLVRLRESASA